MSNTDKYLEAPLFKGHLIHNQKNATMAYNDDRSFGGGNRPVRQMFDISAMGLKCAECGKDITELPFQPSSDRPVYCFDCNKKRRDKFKRDRY